MSEFDPSFLFGKEISVRLVKNAIRLTYMRYGKPTDMVIYDAKQMCCEARFITTDDDLPFYDGATFLGLMLSAPPADWDNQYEPDDEDDNGDDAQFLTLRTSKGDIVFVTHNQHNGYYSGFELTITSGYMYDRNKED